MIGKILADRRIKYVKAAAKIKNAFADASEEFDLSVSEMLSVLGELVQSMARNMHEEGDEG